MDEVFTRMNIPNHPSNTMLLCKKWEEDFDDFHILVNVIGSRPCTSELQNFSTRANINGDQTLLHFYGPDYEFPHPPLDQISRTAPTDVPPISHFSLFIHARSCLLATCTTEAYTGTPGPETMRSRYYKAEELDFGSWECDLNEEDLDMQGDGGHREEPLFLDEDCESALDSADSGTDKVHSRTEEQNSIHQTILSPCGSRTFRRRLCFTQVNCSHISLYIVVPSDSFLYICRYIHSHEIVIIIIVT